MDVSHLPVFSGLSDDVVRDALAHFRPANVEFGMQLMEEGEADSTMLCVVDGELEIRTGDTLLGKAKAGEVVGEMALFGYGMRMATVEALTNADLLLLDRDGYAALRDSGSPVAKAVEQLALRTLMARLTSTSDRIAAMADGSPTGSVAPPKSFFQKVASLFGGGGRRQTSSLNHRAILEQAPFFQKFSEGGLDSLADMMVGVEYSPGEFVCSEGDSGDEMFIVAEGLLDVFINTGDDRVEPLASLEPGDAFGMLALFNNRPRMASCVARTDVACLALSKERWDAVVDAHSPAGSALRGALIRCLSDQLAFANARLSQLDLTKRKKSDQQASLLVVSAGMDTYGPAGRNGSK